MESFERKAVNFKIHGGKLMTGFLLILGSRRRLFHDDCNFVGGQKENTGEFLSLFLIGSLSEEESEDFWKRSELRVERKKSSMHREIREPRNFSGSRSILTLIMKIFVPLPSNELSAC